MRKHSRAVKTGLPRLDSRLGGGLRRGDLICVGGRRRMGKTSFGLTVADHIALGPEPMAVLIFSLEMARLAVMQSLISARSGVPLREIRSGFFPKESWTKLTTASARLSEGAIFINDAKCSAEAVCRLARKWAAEQRAGGTAVGAIIVDHLQLLGRGVESGEAAAKLKALAVELNLPVLLLCDVRMRDKDGMEQRPTASDLLNARSTAGIADTLAFLVKLEGEAEVLVTKAAAGRPGTVKLGFDHLCARFMPEPPA